MKEATGEVSMTVITIVILALLVGVGTWLFSSNGPARNWINDFSKAILQNQMLEKKQAQSRIKK